MTSTDVVQAEIRRFLRSPEPEVLCVTGDWGVGKTYTWQTLLDETKADKSIALGRYSYASLFGINSLEGLKTSIFENLEFLDAPPETVVEQAAHGAKSLAALAKKLGGAVAALPFIGDFLSKAAPLYFSLVREQIVCIDDLERRGAGLDVKDVFGLISFLREQRSCKIMLLLNSDALGDARDEFDTLFEKVIDARLIFAPTATEAVAIALSERNEITETLRKSCETLGISNIRVIKKIERLARQVQPLLKDFLPEITTSAVRSIVMFGWSKFQPSKAPALDYIREDAMAKYAKRKNSDEELSSKEKEWDTILELFEFRHLDVLDHELLKFVDSGILDPNAIRERATEINDQFSLHKESGSFVQAWTPFHDTFEDNLDEVVNSLVKGAKDNFRVVSLRNLNEAIRLLKEFGRQRDAQDLLDFFVAHKPSNFWAPESDFFQRGPYEVEVESVMAAQQEKEEEVFAPDVELVEAGRTYDRDKIGRLAQVSVDEYYRLLKAKRGDDLRTFILSALGFRRIANASPEMREVIRRMEDALKKVASESALNAIRVRKYGVDV